ncbi:hypothetical protein [Providencia vermicola]|uniref:hypothetical protein n=1 Tax=Providencia vermicola TaxID=333965 RepID=UPI0032DA16D9
MKDKEIIENLLKYYDDLTWTEVITLINDLSDTVRPFIYQRVIDSPTPKMKSRMRELLSKKEEKEKKKIKKEYQYKCCHYNCAEPAIQSHVISKSAVLAPLADTNNKMYHFASEINSIKCILKSRHIDRVSSFPGYCKKHDEDIFREVDQGSSVNDKFVHLSVMRVLKKEIFDLRVKISLQDDLSEKWNDVCSECINEPEDVDLIYLNECNDFFINMNEKIRIMKNKIKRYESLYDNIFSKIEELTTLKYNLIEAKCVRSCFSIMIDLPLKDGSDGELHFVFYLPINNQGVMIVVKENNKEGYDPMIIDEKGKLSLYFWMFILLKKESLFFSSDILKTFSDYQMKVLHTNYNFFEPTYLEGLVVSGIYDTE